MLLIRSDVLQKPGKVPPSREILAMSKLMEKMGQEKCA
jgi:hypothetical protein